MIAHQYTTSRLKHIATIFIMVIISGCATSHFGAGTIKRAATNVPDYFMIIESGNKQTIQEQPGDGCRNPIVDPRDGEELELVRSSDTEGDYRVPSTGKYGVMENELLRIDCTNGYALGIVKE